MNRNEATGFPQCALLSRSLISGSGLSLPSEASG